MGKYLFKDTDLLCGLYASSTILLSKNLGIFSLSDRMVGWELTLAKRLGFYKRLFSGEVDKLGQMIR